MRPSAIPLTPVWVAFAALFAFLVALNLAITPLDGSKTIPGWRTYTNREFEFTFQYPPTLRVVKQQSSDLLSLRIEPVVQTGPIAAGVNELTLSVINQSLNSYRSETSLMTEYLAVTVDGRTAYRSETLQGIEGLIQNVMLSLDGKTIAISASGERIALLDNILTSFRYLATNSTNTIESTNVTNRNTNIANTNISTNGNDNVDNTNTTSGECRQTGCGGQVCSDQDVVTTCEYKVEYVCYETATCERQADGECGWTVTESLRACLEAASRNQNTY